MDDKGIVWLTLNVVSVCFVFKRNVFQIKIVNSSNWHSTYNKPIAPDWYFVHKLYKYFMQAIREYQISKRLRISYAYLRAKGVPQLRVAS